MPHDPELAHTLGSDHFEVVFTSGFKHASAHEQQVFGNERQGDDRDRENQVLEKVAVQVCRREARWIRSRGSHAETRQ